MKIREESQEDFKNIHELVKVAFQTAKVSNGKEQDFVDELRASKEKYLPELALVVEKDGKIIGHIMMTRMFISDGNDRFEVLFVGPVSVLLEKRNQGVGTALMRESLDRARKMGFKGAFLVGDPGYYHRFGFRNSSDFNVTHAHEIPGKYVMALELFPGALKDIRGIMN